jgi:hypothetical protein
MKRLLFLAVMAWVGWVGSAHAGPCGCEAKCREVPPAECPDCSPPCQGHHHCSEWKSAHAHKLIDDLCAEDCCTRIKAAKKLGCRLHADFCCDCDVLPSLVRALLADPCWEVRRAAAWSIAMQGARTDLGVLALYISSRLDRHYLVRDRAAEALDILTLCRKPCFKELYKAADALVAQLQRDKVRPGADGSEVILGSLHVPCAVPATVVQPGQPPMVEKIIYKGVN